MGDTGEDFKAFNEMKRAERERKEPNRIQFAKSKISEIGFQMKIECEKITIYLPKGQLTFWPYTGWFCGQKPYGKIKGRGIENLIKQLKNL